MSLENLKLPFILPIPNGLTSGDGFGIKGIPKPEAQSFTVAFDMKPDGILFKMTANYCKGILEGQSLRDGKLYGPENLGKNPFPREEPFFLTITAEYDSKKLGSTPFFILKVGNEKYRYNVPLGNIPLPVGMLEDIYQLEINGDLTLESVNPSNKNDN